MKNNVLSVVMLAFLLLAQSCGFTPVYATKEGAALAGLNNVNLVSVIASPSIQPLVTNGFTDRQSLTADPSTAEYDLTLEAEEFAQRLAVQIDASVTRFNYLLRADYILVRREDGKVFRGSAEAVSSFNVVTSQYSTLFAEEQAKEKAARTLMEEIERDILLSLNEERPETTPRLDRPAIEFNQEYTR